MLFQFDAFIDELRNDEEKKELIQKYEKHFGPIQGGVEDQLWYKEYLINFAAIPYRVKDELADEFDWNLLLKLVAGSFSSECVFEQVEQDDESTPNENEEDAGPALQDLVISVKSGDQSVVKKVSELWSFQIDKLYKIYIEEQMNLQVLMKEDEKEQTVIMGQRTARLQRRKLVIDAMDTAALAAQAKKEKESKLDDLYSQLG